LTNEKGNAVSAYDYEAFGRVTEKEGSFRGNPYRFSTKEHGAGNLYYYGARYYDPQVGRWLTQDPLGMVDGTNTYAFIGNNPVNFVDPWGEQEAVLGGGLTDMINRTPNIFSMQLQQNRFSGMEKSATGGEENRGSGGDDPWWKKLSDWLRRWWKQYGNPPEGNVHWDAKRGRWVDDKGRVYTNHDWGGEPRHIDRGSPDGAQEKSWDNGKNWAPK
jgi:RHS repeat-associated protein